MPSKRTFGLTVFAVLDSREKSGPILEGCGFHEIDFAKN
jgi:hypothetical protein